MIGSRSDTVWAEIWPDIGPRIQHVLATGEATWDEALLLYLERSGFSEETYHTFSYSPLSDDAGATTGMLCVVAEVTERAIGERQLSVLRDVGTTAGCRIDARRGHERVGNLPLHGCPRRAVRGGFSRQSIRPDYHRSRAIRGHLYDTQFYTILTDAIALFARQSNGQIHVYSELGQGTTMSLYLPRYHGEATDAEMAEEGVKGFEGGYGETVLVIDDEPTFRLLLVDVLQDAGYRVLEAADGPSGLKTLQSEIRIDLLVTDVGLPGGMNGRQVADAGRTLRPDLKVLFITGYAENALLGNGRLEPSMHVITKPFAIDALANKVRTMIDT